MILREGARMLAETVLGQVGGCEHHSAHRPRTWRQGGGGHRDISCGEMRVLAASGFFF